MDQFDKALRYIFVLSLILILVAYYAGSTNLASTIGQQVNSLILTSTGRNAQGQFANYPH
jgi:hypothetical protein